VCDRVGPRFGGHRLELGVRERVHARSAVACGRDGARRRIGRLAEHEEVQLGAVLLGDLLARGDARERERLDVGRGGLDDDDDLAHSTFASVASFSTSASGESTIWPA
jgi:hypothetical protein